jgi:hypothetical protein
MPSTCIHINTLGNYRYFMARFAFHYYPLLRSMWN